MSPRPPKAFDVWFVSANTVYKAVPYHVVADWTQQGRLAAGDMVRPAGTEEAWKRVANHDLLADYLARPSGAKVTRMDPPQPAAAADVAPAAPAAVVASATVAAEAPAELP